MIADCPERQQWLAGPGQSWCLCTQPGEQLCSEEYESMTLRVVSKVPGLIYEGATFLYFARERWVQGYLTNSCLSWLSLKNERVFWRLGVFCVMPLKGMCPRKTWSGRSSKCCSLISPPAGVKGLLLFMVRMALHGILGGIVRDRDFSRPSGAEPCRFCGMGR